MQRAPAGDGDGGDAMDAEGPGAGEDHKDTCLTLVGVAVGHMAAFLKVRRRPHETLALLRETAAGLISALKPVTAAALSEGAQ